MAMSCWRMEGARTMVGGAGRGVQKITCGRKGKMGRSDDDRK